MNNETKHIEVDWIKRWAMYAPKKLALKSVEDGIELTYQAFNDSINRTAKYLAEKYTISKGDRVAIISINRIEYVVLFYAIQKLGAIMLPMNFRLTAPELSYQLEDAEAELLIYEEDFEGTVEKLTYTPPQTSHFDGDEGISAVIFAEEVVAEVPHAGEFEDVCMILYTSGTTGRPK